MPRTMVLDGATGTELERRGVDISLPLWSARAVIDAPDVLRGVHEAYFRAGAVAVTAATFRTHGRTLAKEGLGDRAASLTAKAVDLAAEARDLHRPGGLVLGSVAPLADCYRPDLAPGESACRAEHGAMVAHLADAGADAILIETMNNLTEAAAAAGAAESSGRRWMISFCTRGEDEPGILLSGEPLTAILGDLAGASAVGVNCVAAPAVIAQVRFLRERLPPAIAIIAYANIGYADSDGNWVITDAVSPPRYASYARRWIDAGATIVGGCCGTTPETIREVKRAISHKP